jgi:hypothetical protein
MNPFLIVGGIAALLLWSKNSKAKASAGTTPTGPASSPANPSWLDRPLEPTGPPVVLENPVEPTGPSDVPEIRETTPEIVVVDDGNWSEGSTSNVDSQLGLQDNQSAIPSPANPSGIDNPLEPIVATPSLRRGYFVFPESQDFEKKLMESGYYNPKASVSTKGHTSNWWSYLRFDVLPDFNKQYYGTMGQAPFYRALMLELQKQGKLNDQTLEAFVAKQKKRWAPKVTTPTNYRAVNSSGWVHQGQGVYSRPQGTSDCPEGYFYSESRVWTRGFNRCITEDRYVQIVKEKMPQINPMPASVWQDVILLNYAGNFYDRSVLTMPASELVKEIRDRVVGCSNQWCKVVQNTFLTDTTAFANDRFTFKDVVWATMDNNYIAFYPIPVKAGGSKRKAAPVYAMFPVTQAEYNDYKEYNRISKL